MKRLLEKFAISARLESFADYYEAAKREYAAHGNEILNFEKFPVFTHMAEDIRRISEGLAEDEDNVLFAYFLNAAIRAYDIPAIDALSGPKAALGSELYDSISLFALLWELPKMVGNHRRRRVPEEITAATLEMFQNQVGDYILLYGRHGLRTYVRWMLKFVRSEIIRVGRFNFEMCRYREPFDIFERDGELLALAKGATLHRSGRILGSVDCEDEAGSFVATVTETDGYYEGYPSLGGTVSTSPVRLSKSEWKPVLTAGDKIVSVHIPTGGPLTPEVCERDFALGREVIERCFTDFKMFYCTSWLLDTELKSITGKEGNVTRFGDRFTRFPMKSNAKAVFTYVFDALPETPPAELPEKSSFARAIKAHLINGGRVYGASGVFAKPKTESPEALIPRPVQIVLDDMGWFNGEDDRAAGGPSRTGMKRRHVAEDLRAINLLGEQLGMKINCAFVVGEWDPDNRLSDVKHLSKYGDNWDNASHLDRAEMARFVEAINESPYIEIALHGLLHGYYMEGVDNHDTSDYYYRKGGKLIMVDPDEIRHRVAKFRDMLDYYGIEKQPVSFVPPSFICRWGELSGVLSELGFKYGSTIYRTMDCEGERPEIVGVENGIVTVDRNLNIYPWDDCDCSFDDLPPMTGIFGTHWPNFLHMDPARSGEVIDRAVRYFEGCAGRYGAVMSRGIEFCAVQSMYHRFARVEYTPGVMKLDLSEVAKSPVGGRPFVISTRGEITSAEGGSLRFLEDKGEFRNYELTPTGTIVTVRLKTPKCK